ncbi:MAG: hypothetical protein ACRD3D_08855 [Terriglobia bacterium]
MIERVARTAAACLLTAAILYAAHLAVRDCPAGIQVSKNCLWMWVRGETGLPASRLLQSLLLFLVGVILLVGLAFTWRYVFGPVMRKNCVRKLR